ncbi:MAG: hypothetical protein AB7G93_02230 [Bdellovibrionales bacterium]
MIKLLFLAAQTWAASPAGDGHGHGPVEIPWGPVSVQAFNLGLLIAVLVWILRKAVKAHFEHRAREYKDMVVRAEEAKREAERGRQQIKERLAKLESTAEAGVAQARKEAEELKIRMIQEARDLSLKMEDEARRTTQVELENAKMELRHELLGRALEASRESLQKNLSSNEQKQLQNEFVEKIQVVGG